MALTQISTDGIKNGTITGTDLATNVDLVDNQKIRFGTGNDLEIYHNSGFSYIDAQGDQLRIDADQLRVRSDSGESYIEADANSAVKLYFDGSLKANTRSDGFEIKQHLTMGDSDEIRLGNSSDLQIYHDGTNSHVQNGTGTLRIRGDSIKLNNNAASENYLVATANGSVELYYDNVKKFETTTTGVTVTGQIISDGLQMGDSDIAKFGSHDDLQIYHDGSVEKIESSGGGLHIRQISNSDIHIHAGADSSSSNNRIVARSAGQAELYYSGNKKFETTSDGATLTGSLTVTDDISLQDDLLMGDTDAIKLGNSADLQIFHDGGDSAIEIPSGKVGNLNLNMLNGSAGTFIRTNSSSMRNLTLKKNDSGADNVDYFQCRNSANSLKLQIQGTGDVRNTNNSYGQISDIKLKENVVDANSQWNDIKAIRVRNWNYKESTGLPTHTQIGVVAQELETVSPGLVDEQIDRDNDTGKDLGTTTKGVKYSVLYIKAVKCLQEAMARIEVLESEVAALKAS